jgi:4-carboxymuconolactone decarboxylase
MSRITPVDVGQPERLTAEQRRVYDEMMAGPRGHVTGPFPYLLRTPEICDHVQKLGAYCRYGSSLPRKVMELTVLVTARHWNAYYEWGAHAPLARKEGASDATVQAIAERRRPAGDEDAALVWDLVTTLLGKRGLDDALYAKGIARFGEGGMLDLATTVGYYGLLAQVFNVFAIGAPATAEKLPD